MKTAFQEGFAPYFHEDSVLLILGSFPSVKSREVGFYYGNKQNRFWSTVCSFFGEEIPSAVEGKKDFLRRRKIALWDVVLSCQIAGSSDSSIAQEMIADVPKLLENSKITHIFCNGSKSYELFSQKFPKLLSKTKKLTSTSPANPRFTLLEWHTALKEVFLDGKE